MHFKMERALYQILTWDMFRMFVWFLYVMRFHLFLPCSWCAVQLTVPNGLLPNNSDSERFIAAVHAECPCFTVDTCIGVRWVVMMYPCFEMGRIDVTDVDVWNRRRWREQQSVYPSSSLLLFVMEYPGITQQMRERKSVRNNGVVIPIIIHLVCGTACW